MALSVELLSHRPRLQQKAYEVGKDGLYAINKARFTKSSHQVVLMQILVLCLL